MKDLTPKIKWISANEKIVVPDMFSEKMSETVGGWSASPNELSSGKIRFLSQQEQILIGNATAPLTGEGIFQGLYNLLYQWRVGNPAGDYAHWDGTNLIITGTLTASILKYGKTSFTDTVNAGYYISTEGAYLGAANDVTKLKYTIADGSFNFIGTISSKSTADVVAAFGTGADKSNIITDLINVRLNSSAKTILSDFTFSSTDYSGALKTGDITWNVSTGAITGGSGGLFNKKGITFAKAGVATIILDGTTGDATFAGTLSAAAGTLGSITAGTLTGLTITGGTISIGSGNAIFKADSNGIYLGNATFASAPFRVDMAGALVATSATISGSVTATSGAMGGWTIGATAIYDTAGLVGMSSAITAGDDIRFWAGHTTPASAPFKVTEAGVLTASSATITGTINATAGYFGGTTNGVNVDSTGLTLTGTGYIQTASSGARAVMTGNDLYLYDDTTGGINPPTGDNATLYLLRTDDTTQKFDIRHRAGINYDSENVVEIFFD